MYHVKGHCDILWQVSQGNLAAANACGLGLRLGLGIDSALTHSRRNFSRLED